MPFYTDAEIAKRKAAGVKMNKLDCGWNLPPEITAAVTARINQFIPQTDAERRNKKILELAFIHDMNTQQIARLNDPLLIGMGNRNHGNPISSKFIYQVCIDFAPEVITYRKGKRTNAVQQRRNALYKQRQQGTVKRQTVCATCGSNENIELHHIIPVKGGGTDDYFNLISLCHDCHMKLHHRIYDRLQWASEIPNKDNIV